MTKKVKKLYKSAAGLAQVMGVLVCAVTSAEALENTGFETPDQGSSDFAYTPANALWTFSAKAGVGGPTSPWKCNNISPDPLGDQFAFLQNMATITQNMTGLATGGTYALSFFESYRTVKDPGNDLKVILDEGLPTELVIYSNNNVDSTTWILRQTAAFVATTNSYTLTFRTTNPLGSSDNRTTIIDGVYLTLVNPPPLSYTPISNDMDCGITAFKTYTHKLDFGLGVSGALINGVQFNAYNKGANGTLDFKHTFSDGVLSDHAGRNLVNVSGSLSSLMMDLSYNSTFPAGATMTSTLSGLTPEVTYDVRIYVRQWDSNPNRLVTLVFDPDGAGPISHTTPQINQDDATTAGMATASTAYTISYRFKAVEGENLVATATQHNAGQAWHFYGLTCEVVEPTLKTLSPSDNSTGILPYVNLVANFNANVRKGSGNVTLKRSSDDSVAEAFDVNDSSVAVSGTQVTLNPVNDLETATGYYIQVDAGAFEDYAGRSCPAVTDKTLWNFTTVTDRIAFVKITGDADCDINSSKVYTHKLDFGQGAPGALINGVQFSAYNNAANGTLNFRRWVSSGDYRDDASNLPPGVSGALINLMSDIYFNHGNSSGGTTTWTLSGLMPGVAYNVRVYVRQWASGIRLATLTFDPDGAGPIADSVGPINEDDATSVGLAEADAYYISYQFTAVDGEPLVITAAQHVSPTSWHLYGITNEKVPLDGTIILIH